MTPNGAHETTWLRGAGQDAVQADAPGLAQQRLGERRAIGRPPAVGRRKKRPRYRRSVSSKAASEP